MLVLKSTASVTCGEKLWLECACVLNTKDTPYISIFSVTIFFLTHDIGLVYLC
jgi:hypothetical protein